ncbi:hypothetical protein ACOMCP_00673 [Lactiplantibacillus plantarum]|uniref:BppU N-terminal domain-containing protein n=1 Tax=Lactiplantibacillus plantarum TaxID=1590 RepID=A0A1E3KPC6_LACPN|nr:BppU family phage baseplate upper protein [Lactiplantibacillus plantarum]ODO60734.1 hypothetical protein LPJSA22_00681 [Lactiplantibacillus plantarum]
MQTLTYTIGADKRTLVKDIQDFKINFSGSNYNWVQARQYERSMRQVFVNVKNEDGTPYDLTGCNVWFQGRLPDNTHRVIDAKHGVMIDPVNGQFRFDMPAQAFAVAGSYVQAFFRIMKDGDNLATLEFNLEVLADTVIQGLIPADYITPFEDLYGKLEDVFENADADLKAKLASWETKLTTTLADWTGDYADIQKTVTALNSQLADALQKFADGKVVTPADLSTTLAGSLGTLTNFKASGTTLVDKVVTELTERQINVKWYGAIGDGTSDDSVAINAAIEAASAIKGTVFVPAGKYLLTHDLVFKSNIVFEMDHNAVLYAPGQYFRFDTTTTGYGGGVSNVIVRGGTFAGNYDATSVTNAHADGNAFNGALHHAQHIEFDRVTFHMTTSNSHTLDLGGCDDIYVHDCDFEGMLVRNSREYVEAVQVDYSQLNALTYHDDVQDANLDGLPTINVKVTNNRFVPIYAADGTVKYPAPNPFGEHAAYDSGCPKHLSFIGNTVLDAPKAGGAVLSEAWVHFVSVSDLTIKDNTFKNTTHTANSAIGLYSTDMPLPNYNGTVTGTLESTQEGVEIVDNTFIGFDAAEQTKAIVELLGNKDSGSKDVLLDSNTFIDNLNASFDWSADSGGATAIKLVNYQRAIVINNVADTVNRFLDRPETAITDLAATLTVKNNSLNNVAYVPLVISFADSQQPVINVSNNLLSQVREAMYIKAVKGTVGVEGNAVWYHRTSHLVGSYSNTSITVNSKDASIKNNTVRQSSVAKYPQAFILTSAPTGWSGNTFNGDGLVNTTFSSASNSIMSIVDNTTSAVDLNNYIGPSGYYPLKGGITAWVNGPDDWLKLPIYGYMELTYLNDVVFQQVYGSNNTCYRRLWAGSPKKWTPWTAA